MELIPVAQNGDSAISRKAIHIIPRKIIHSWMQMLVYLFIWFVHHFQDKIDFRCHSFDSTTPRIHRFSHARRPENLLLWLIVQRLPRDSWTILDMGHYEEFAQMIEIRWDGIAIFCQWENKVFFGFAEGLKTKVGLNPLDRTKCVRVLDRIFSPERGQKGSCRENPKKVPSRI